MVFNRKRKDNRSSSFILDDSPKRTKVQAQRKFAQTSNINSPVLTPVIETEIREKVMPEPIELLPMKRPNTEDFLTFLCFRGTPALPPNLSFFNNATMTEGPPPIGESASSSKNGVILPANIGKTQGDKPFIAFGVRKRADPVVVSRHMDKKRRHALALQALRRKYQEQKMAKIRAITISKLSEKVHTNKTVVRTTRSITKNEPLKDNDRKKNVAQKTKITVVATKHVKVTTKRTIQQAPSTRNNIKQKMTLRNLRNRVVKRACNEQVKTKNKKMTKLEETDEADEEVAEEQSESGEEDSEDSSSDNEKESCKKLEVKKTNVRVTRSNILQSKRILLKQQNIKGATRSPRLRNQLRRKILQGKTELASLNSKRRMLTRKVHVSKDSKIIAKQVQNVQSMAKEKSPKVAKGEKKEIGSKETSKANIRENLRKRQSSGHKNVADKNKNIHDKRETAKKGGISKVTNDEKDELKGTDSKVTRSEKKIDGNLNKRDIDSKSKKADVVDKPNKILPKDGKTLTKNAEFISFSPTQSPAELNVVKNENEDKHDVIKAIKPKVPESKKTLKVDGKSLASKQILPVIENNRFIIDKDVIIEEIQPFKRLSVPASCSLSSNNEQTTEQNRKAVVTLDKSTKNVTNGKEVKTEQVKAPKKSLERVVKQGKDVESSTKYNTKSSESFGKATTPEIKQEKSESTVRERPARKTKLAAAIYMEILGRKLVNDDDVDDLSIDSFPELPNVRKMEQRENELKAKQEKQKTTKKGSEKVEKSEKASKVAKKQIDSVIKSTTYCIGNDFTDRASKCSEKAMNDKRKLRLNLSQQCESTNCSAKANKTTSDDSDSEKLIFKKLKKAKNDPKLVEDNEKICNKTKSLAKKNKLDDTFSFSESDEEPLVKLKTQKNPEHSTDKAKVKIKQEDDQQQTVMKQKRECAKRPQNYLPTFSSSDEEDKFFKIERPPPKRKANKIEVVPQATALINLEMQLSCRDIGKRFGKGKVNMSNEQIEKWLNDSALAGSMVIKAENDEMLKFGECIPTETSLDNNLSTVNMEHLKNSLFKEEKLSYPPIKTEGGAMISPVHTTPEKSTTGSQKPLSNEKKTIFRKQDTLQPQTKNSAFSACNESSVYAFEADNEDSVSTPFRRPSRRPSSTATSRSEDLSADIHVQEQRKFRLPPAIAAANTLMPIPTKTKEVLMLTDDSNTSGPITVQVNLESGDGDNEVSGVSHENEHMFYLPFQPGTRNTQNNIQGVAIKMGTEFNTNKVVMSAKLVRHTSSGSLDKAQPSPLSMFPPSSPNINYKSTKQEKTRVAMQPCCSMSETSDSGDFKYKIPSSPSASSSSSAKLGNSVKRILSKQSNEELYKPVNDSEFPDANAKARIAEAPIFYPSEKEFIDPLEYIEKIRVKAERFGICRIVPPGNFKPECKVLDEMRFTAYNQYVHKMMHRWGPNFKELVAIRRYLATQSISLKHPPWIGGIEVDLPKLYQTVQMLGGLKEVIEKKKWSKVSEMMHIPKSAQDRVTKLDDMYCKYLLPYDTLSHDEREKLFSEVEAGWVKREDKLLEKAKNSQTLENRNIKNEAEDTEEEESSDEDASETDVECIIKGRSMALSAFYRIARNTMATWFKDVTPTPEEVEEAFWKHVTEREHHICVHSGSIDSGNFGYGFSVTKHSPFARHAWNLKVLTNNSGSILRSMGPVMGLTVPTLHVGMLYAGCCWYRDPHSLPWIEYLHTGANKIWYGIPDTMSDRFHQTMLKLVPHYCLNKSLWLPTDTVMVPPSTLVEYGVSLTKTLQEPGQFVVVFPKAFTSNICAGYVVSESVFWATPEWLNEADQVFLQLRNSCEPSMFSYERLLLSMAQDPRSDVKILQRIIPPIERMIEREKKDRASVRGLGIRQSERLPLLDAKRKKKMQDTDTEYICEECRWNLYCSMICDSPDNSFYCLEHAVENIQEKRLEIDNLKLMYTYDDDELENFVRKIHEVIEAKLMKKVGKFAGMATLLNR